MEEVNERLQSIVPSNSRPRGPEDVLDSHHKRTRVDKKAPDPLAVAQFREGLEKSDKANAVTNKSPVSMRHVGGGSESALQSTVNANSNVFQLSTISSSAKKRSLEGQLHHIAFGHHY